MMKLLFTLFICASYDGVPYLTSEMYALRSQAFIAPCVHRRHDPPVREQQQQHECTQLLLTHVVAGLAALVVDQVVGHVGSTTETVL
jgi:hypothetical protein